MMKALFGNRAWLLLVVLCVWLIVFLVRDWLSARRAARNALVPRYTCPQCGRKALVYGFGDASGGSMAQQMSTFRAQCTRCTYVGAGRGPL